MIKKIEAYETTDGATFRDRKKAMIHQARLHLATAIVEDHNYIYGEIKFSSVDELIEFCQRHKHLLLTIID